MKRRTFLLITAAAAAVQAQPPAATTTAVPKAEKEPYMPSACAVMFGDWLEANGTGWSPGLPISNRRR